MIFIKYVSDILEARRQELIEVFKDPASDYYYKTSNGLPWAIHLSEPFDFPNESTPINQAYLFFTNWATSGGNSNTDWYLDLPGYRDSSKIYD